MKTCRECIKELVCKYREWAWKSGYAGDGSYPEIIKILGEKCIYSLFKEKEDVAQRGESDDVGRAA